MLFRRRSPGCASNAGKESSATRSAARARRCSSKGIGEPIFARIFDTGCFPCGATLSYRCYANLAVEGELAVRLGQAVSAPSGGVDECRAAITSVFPVIELHHYVLRSPQPSLAELIASGGMHAGFVLAEEEPEVGLPDLESLSVWIDDQRMGMVAGADVT